MRNSENIDFNIYEGMEVTGIPSVTLSRGRVVWENGQLKTERGTGLYINRPPFPFYWDSVQRRNELGESVPVERNKPKPAAK